MSSSLHFLFPTPRPDEADVLVAGVVGTRCVPATGGEQTSTCALMEGCVTTTVRATLEGGTFTTTRALAIDDAATTGSLSAAEFATTTERTPVTKGATTSEYSRAVGCAETKAVYRRLGLQPSHKVGRWRIVRPHKDVRRKQKKSRRGMRQNPSVRPIKCASRSREVRQRVRWRRALRQQWEALRRRGGRRCRALC